VTELADVLGRVTSATAMLDLAGKRGEVGEVVCAVLDGLDGQKPTKAQRGIWATLTRAAWPAVLVLVAVLCLGRRFGKTFLAAIIVVYEAVVRAAEHERHALAGTRINYGMLAPRLTQSRELMRAVLAVLEWLRPLGVAWETRDMGGNPEIVITSPWRKCEHAIVVITMGPTSVRGFSFAVLVWDEAGATQAAADLAWTGADVMKAARPGQLQFPTARLIVLGTKGPPEGQFYQWVEEKPPTGAVSFLAPTWTNGRFTREQCRTLADGDEHAFQQEYECSRWGWAGENFIDVDGLKIGSPYADQGPRDGSFVVALDMSSGAGADAIGLGCYSAFDAEVSPGHAPVRSIIVEHSESIPPNKADPPSTEFIVGKAVKLSRAFNCAPIVFDSYSKVEVERILRDRHGYYECPADETPGRMQYQQQPMHPQAQTPRFRLLRQLVLGGRLHLGKEHEALRVEIGKLRAVQLASGDLRVEGRKRDDQADCAALGVAIAMTLPPTKCAGGVVIEMVDDGVSFNRQQGRLEFALPKYQRRYPDGTSVSCEIPMWDSRFPEYARSMLATGQHTAAIDAWAKEQQATQRGNGDNGISITVRHG
jgi:hypothetical protein